VTQRRVDGPEIIALVQRDLRNALKEYATAIKINLYKTAGVGASPRDGLRSAGLIILATIGTRDRDCRCYRRRNASGGWSAERGNISRSHRFVSKLNTVDETGRVFLIFVG